ncbi:MAG: carboxypeptidase regulatory-like domain-containing protein [Ectothiorhodospiraceae bacterium]|nr:carboxypeptidase regulatory-like domain-containing protein [Ectothiorhodospiraceae bacterium]
MRRAAWSRTLFLGMALCAGAALAQTERESELTLWRDGDAGEALEIRGRVVDPSGRGIAGAMLSVRQADGTGVYSSQYRGQLRTDASGHYVLRTAMPGNYMGVRHIHVDVEGDGFAPISTQILFRGDPNLEPDAQGGAIVLERTNVEGRDLLTGRFDIKLE